MVILTAEGLFRVNTVRKSRFIGLRWIESMLMIQQYYILCQIIGGKFQKYISANGIFLVQIRSPLFF